MLTFLLASVAVFFGITLFGYIVHWALHQSWAGFLNNSHMTHHLKLYPITDYTSDVYRSAGKDNTVKIFAFAALPILAIPILLCIFGMLSIFTAAFVLAEMLFLGFLHDQIHDSFHLNKSLWKYLPGYKTWAKNHYNHHVDMQSNFGIFFFMWDRLFKTFKS